MKKDVPCCCNPDGHEEGRKKEECTDYYIEINAKPYKKDIISYNNNNKRAARISYIVDCWSPQKNLGNSSS